MQQITLADKYHKILHNNKGS